MAAPNGVGVAVCLLRDVLSVGCIVDATAVGYRLALGDVHRHDGNMHHALRHYLEGLHVATHGFSAEKLEEYLSNTLIESMAACLSALKAYTQVNFLPI